MRSVPPHPLSGSGGFPTIEVQFIPSFEFEAEIARRQQGTQLTNQERTLWLREQRLLKARNAAVTDEDYERLSDELWDVQQAMTELEQKLDDSADSDY